MIVIYFFCEISVFSAFLLSKLHPLFFNFSKNASIDGIFFLIFLIDGIFRTTFLGT